MNTRSTRRRSNQDNEGGIGGELAEEVVETVIEDVAGSALGGLWKVFVFVWDITIGLLFRILFGVLRAVFSIFDN